MVEKYTGFKASDGSIHDTEREAYLLELRLIVREVMGNDALAATFVNAIGRDPHYIHNVIKEIAARTTRVDEALALA